jgi:hypothetical protein
MPGADNSVLSCGSAAVNIDILLERCRIVNSTEVSYGMYLGGSGMMTVRDSFFNGLPQKGWLKRGTGTAIFVFEGTFLSGPPIRDITMRGYVSFFVCEFSDYLTEPLFSFLVESSVSCPMHTARQQFAVDSCAPSASASPSATEFPSPSENETESATDMPEIPTFPPTEAESETIDDPEDKLTIDWRVPVAIVIPLLALIGLTFLLIYLFRHKKKEEPVFISVKPVKKSPRKDAREPLMLEREPVFARQETDEFRPEGARVDVFVQADEEEEFGLEDLDTGRLTSTFILSNSDTTSM